jgi:hypothetical protein
MVWGRPGSGELRLAELFPLFVTVWQDPAYNAAVRVALPSYLDANAANPVQNGIALAQLALESPPTLISLPPGGTPLPSGRPSGLT